MSAWREDHELGAEPCTPIYVYSWRARVGCYVALVVGFIAVAYVFLIGP